MNTNLLRGIQVGFVVILAATQVSAKPNRTVVAGQSLGGVRLGSTRRPSCQNFGQADQFIQFERRVYRRFVAR